MYTAESLKKEEDMAKWFKAMDWGAVCSNPGSVKLQAKWVSDYLSFLLWLSIMTFNLWNVNDLTSELCSKVYALQGVKRSLIGE